MSSGTGNITASAGRNITLGLANALSTGGTVTLTAGGVVSQAVSGTTITANSLMVTATGADVNNASVGTATQALVFNAPTLSVDSSASNGNQFLNDTTAASVTFLTVGIADLAGRPQPAQQWHHFNLVSGTHTDGSGNGDRRRQ